MVNPNKKIKRPDGLGKLYNYQEDENGKIYTIPILETVKNNYAYIYRQIKDEKLLNENDTCLYFKEIVYDDEVIGFATYRSSSFDENTLVLQYFYTLPEYKQPSILVEELDEAGQLFQSSIIIAYPTRKMVDSLIKHKLARVYDDRIAISKIAFMIESIDVTDAGDVMLEDYPTDNKETQHNRISLIYDLKLNAVVALANEDSEDDEDEYNFNTISLPLRRDDKENNCIELRRTDELYNSGNYYQYVKSVLDDNNDNIQNWLSLI